MRTRGLVLQLTSSEAKLVPAEPFFHNATDPKRYDNYAFHVFFFDVKIKVLDF